MEQDKASLLQHIKEIEEEHKQTVLRLQHHVQEKEKVLAAEFAEAEQVYKANEHDLKEQLEEKTQIIEVNRFIDSCAYCILQTNKLLVLGIQLTCENRCHRNGHTW